MIPSLGRSLLRMHLLSNALRREMMYDFNRSLSTLDAFNHYQPPRINDNSYYKMKVEVNKNGHVQVKTVSKEPGKEWNIKVEEYSQDNKNQKMSLEQEKSQKVSEAIDQYKNENVTETKETENVKKEQENVLKAKTTNAPETSTKEEKSIPKEEVKKEQKFERNEQNKELSSQAFESPFDEIQSIFNSIERDFGFFDDIVPSRRFRQRDNYHMARQYESPFDEFDAIFDSMERDFERVFGYYDPFYRRLPIKEARGSEGKETIAKEEGKSSDKKETPQTSN